MHATIGLEREACNAWAGWRTEHQTHDGRWTGVSEWTPGRWVIAGRARAG